MSPRPSRTRGSVRRRPPVSSDSDSDTDCHVDADLDPLWMLAVLFIVLFAVSMMLGGCAATPLPAAAPAPEDGLLRADSSHGELYLKVDHNIGGYDQAFFPPIQVSHHANRSGLHMRETVVLSVNLGQRLRARAAAGGIGVASAAGPCAMTMAFSIKDVEIDELMSKIERGANVTFITSMGAVTLQVVIRDSLTDTPLLRFSERRKLGGGQLRGSGRAGLLRGLEKTLDLLLADFALRLQETIPRSSHQNKIAPECRSLIRRASEALGGLRSVPAKASSPH